MRITYDTILKDTDPRLRNPSQPIKTPLSTKHLALAKRMLRYVKDSRIEEKADKYNLKPAVGLAAPQVGEFVQIIMVMVDYAEEEPTIYLLANPKIIAHSIQNSALASGEGCLSVENPHPGYVLRHARITVRAYDILDQKDVIIKEDGYAAVVLQHEIDHLHGVLFYDRINSTNPWEQTPNLILID